MDKEEWIPVKNGISTSQQRQLIEVTNIMARALNESELVAIMKIYGAVTDRLLENK